jgi:hypothetical protein
MLKATVDQVNEFIIGYEECAVWSSTHTPSEDADPIEIDSLEWVSESYTIGELFTPEALATIREDCEAFIANGLDDLLQVVEQPGYSWANAGHDFWLTRNGHGAGFWDRGFGEIGERLSNLARPYGGLDLMVDEENHTLFFG